MSNETTLKRREFKRLTVLVDPDLERQILAEQERLRRESGLDVSKTQVAARAIRQALQKQA